MLLQFFLYEEKYFVLVNCKNKVIYYDQFHGIRRRGCEM